MKLTLVSISVKGASFSAFLNLPIVNGKAVADHATIERMIGWKLPRGTTITIG